MEELTHLLRNRPGAVSGRTWRCAGDAELAGYVDGTLDANARRSLEAHLADCKACLEQVSFLTQTAEWATAADAPGWLVNKARDLVPEKRAGRVFFDWRWATAGAAAVLVIGVITVLAIRSGNSGRSVSPATQIAAQTPPAVTPSTNSERNPAIVATSSSPAPAKPTTTTREAPVPVIRNAATAPLSPKILSPREGAVVKRDALQVRWQEVSNAVFYEVSILSVSGETLMSEQTESAALAVPAGIQLRSGAAYFVSVRAHLRDGKPARSKLVSFRVID